LLKEPVVLPLLPETFALNESVALALATGLAAMLPHV
jgi:hypothetical protein